MYDAVYCADIVFVSVCVCIWEFNLYINGFSAKVLLHLWVIKYDCSTIYWYWSAGCTNFEKWRAINGEWEGGIARACERGGEKQKETFDENTLWWNIVGVPRMLWKRIFVSMNNAISQDFRVSWTRCHSFPSWWSSRIGIYQTRYLIVWYIPMFREPLLHWGSNMIENVRIKDDFIRLNFPSNFLIDSIYSAHQGSITIEG